MLDQQVLIGVEAAFTMVLTAVALVTGLLAANVLAPPERWSGAGGLAGLPPRISRMTREYRTPLAESDRDAS